MSINNLTLVKIFENSMCNKNIISIYFIDSFKALRLITFELQQNSYKVVVGI